MHPMHALSARDPMQQQQLLLNPQDQDQQSTMTVLETLNPAQQQQPPPPHPMGGEQQAQVMGMIDPVQAQRQQQHVVQQHLVQQQQQQQQPHLHQLQPSQQTIEQAMNIDEHHQQLQQQRSQHPLEHHHQQQVTRPQIISGEGIVADSGGPIVQWLLDNYEIAEGESLPRSTVYNHYLAHCRQLQMASVNAASFGKLIRSVFVGLKTRRLGTRGHSKYHYFGVRAKQHVQHELLQHHHHHQQTADGATGAGCSRTEQQNDSSNHRTEDGSESDSTSLAGGAGGDALAASERLTAASSAKRIKPNHQAVYHHLQQQQQQQHKSQQHANEHQQQLELLAAGDGLYYGSTNNGLAAATNGYIKVQHLNSNNNNGNNRGNSPAVGDSCELADARNHLGANWSTLVDEHWPQRDTCSPDDEQLIKAAGGGEWPAYLVDVFESKYRSYYKRMVELLSELKFAEVEQLWQQFWRPPINDAGASGNPPPTGQQQSSVGSSVVADSSAEVQCWPTMIGGPDSAAASAAAAPSTQDDMQQGQQQNGAHQMGQFQQQQQQVELTFSCLYQLTGQPLVVERINQIDYSLYAAIESFLFPDMLSPIPSLLRQQIETFAINVGPCIELATKDYEPRFVAEKSKSARAFGYALRRYAELNRLSTASRAIWERRSSLAQLSMDLSRIDLRYIEHQVSLMTNHKRIDDLSIIRYNNDANNSPNNHQRGSLELQAADGKLNSNNLGRGREQVGDNANTKEDVIANENNSPADENSHQHQLENQSQNHNQRHPNQRHHPHNQNRSQYLCAMQPGQLIQNFLHLLEDPYPASSWPDWCRNLFESRVCGLSMEEARNFVLDEWKNYISRIEKELTLRSAPSLSSFHLIKLLFGEYIDYLVDTRLAQARNKTRIHLSGG